MSPSETHRGGDRRRRRPRDHRGRGWSEGAAHQDLWADRAGKRGVGEVGGDLPLTSPGEGSSAHLDFGSLASGTMRESLLLF